jgi:hypothetical protein
VGYAIEATPIGRVPLASQSNNNSQGLTDFLSVLEAQLNLFITEDALAQGEGAVAGDLVALYKVLGGGWEGSAETPADETEGVQTPANAWSTADLPQPGRGPTHARGGAEVVRYLQRGSCEPLLIGAGRLAAKQFPWPLSGR